MATPFHGGGGARKEVVPSTPEDLRHSAYAISDTGVSKMNQVGSLCGALVSGLMMIGYIFGRRVPEDDVSCASELAFELHERFQDALGSKYCSVLRPFHHKISADPSRNIQGNCGEMYRTGARLAVEVILSAREICPLCPEVKLPASGEGRVDDWALVH